LGLFLSACGQKPTAELQQAEAALAKAKEAGAMEKAPAKYKSAEDKLAEAKRVINQGRYKRAKQLLEEATQLAKMAEQAALAPEKAPVVSATEPMRTGGEATSYVVVKGDCLWNIADQKEIYDDPFQWPLIYQANRDQIKNPDLIYPKQNFNVPKDAPEDQIKQARKKAGAGAPYWPPGPTDYPKSVRSKYYPGN
jgi:hypothetical protein